MVAFQPSSGKLLLERAPPGRWPVSGKRLGFELSGTSWPAAVPDWLCPTGRLHFWAVQLAAVHLLQSTAAVTPAAVDTSAASSAAIHAARLEVEVAVEGDSSAALEVLAVRAQLYRCNAAGEVDPAGAVGPFLGSVVNRSGVVGAQLYRCNAAGEVDPAGGEVNACFQVGLIGAAAGCHRQCSGAACSRAHDYAECVSCSQTAQRPHPPASAALVAEGSPISSVNLLRVFPPCHCADAPAALVAEACCGLHPSWTAADTSGRGSGAQAFAGARAQVGDRELWTC